MEYKYQLTAWLNRYDFCGEIGDIGCVGIHSHIISGREKGVFIPGTDGICGNSNPAIKRRHGWRGTTNDWALFAHGIRKIRSIKYYDDTVKVTFGPDLYPEEE